MDNLYTNNGFTETEDSAKSVTEAVRDNTFLKENLNTPDSAEVAADKKRESTVPADDTKTAESKDTAKPKKSEKKNTPAATKARKTEAEKLAALREQAKKLTDAQSAHKKKGKELDNQLADIRTKIHTAEISRLEEVCGKLNITIPALTEFLEKLPGGKKLSYSDSGTLPPDTVKE